MPQSEVPPGQVGEAPGLGLQAEPLPTIGSVSPTISSISPTISPSDLILCGACQKLGSNGCVADTSKNGQSCGTCRVCASGSCNYAASGTACNDGNSCTKNDKCNGSGSCIGTAYACANPGQCKTATCDGAGGCTVTNKTNGTTCDADSNKCTPVDKCQSGTCVPDAPVTCVQRDCNNVACNPATGNCVETPLTGPSCGVTGCSTNGTCSAGVCSGTPKDCSNLDGPCVTGACDAADGECKAQPVANGTACTLADKCMENTQCLGGDCVGTPKDCSGMASACVDAACDPATGACVTTNKAVGTACALDNQCQENGQCDGNGNCSGSPLADGTPCTLEGCSDATVCLNGACTCGTPQPPDMAMAPTDPGNGDGGGDTGSCSFGGAASAAPFGLLFSALGVLGLALRRRRR